MSQKLKRPVKVSKGKVKFHGSVPLHLVYRRVGYDMPYDEFKKGVLFRGMLKFESSYLPVLVPSVAGRGADADPDEDDLYKDVVESF